jgi:WD40 repeat protein
MYSGDGGRLLIAGTVGQDIPNVWDARTGKQVSALEHNGEFASGSALNMDGALAAILSEDGTVRIWDAETGHLLRTLKASERATLPPPVGPTGVSFSPDSRRLLVANGSSVLVWNLEVETRSPGELAQVVAAKSPWRLVATDGWSCREVSFDVAADLDSATGRLRGSARQGAGPGQGSRRGAWSTAALVRERAK